MSYRIFKLRSDLRIQPHKENKTINYLLSDPRNEKVRKLTFLQYTIARFYQIRAATVGEGVDHIYERCDLLIEEDDILNFLKKLEDLQLIEVDHHLKVPLVARAQISSELEGKTRKLIRQYFKSQPSTTSVNDFFSKLFSCIRTGDVIQTLEICRKFQSNREVEPVALALKTWLEERLSHLQGLSESEELEEPTTEIFVFKNPQKFIQKLTKVFRPFLGLSGVVLYCLLVGYALLLKFSHTQDDMLITDFQSLVRFALAHPISLQLAFHSCGILHELGHGIMCHFFGGEVRKMGLMLFFKIMPAFFCDISDTYFMPKKHRILVALGGILVNTLLWAVFTIVGQMAPVGSSFSIVCYLIALSNATDALFNIVPIFKLDGYFILSDILGVENLWDRSFWYVDRKLGIIPKSNTKYPDETRPFMPIVYFIVCFGNRILIVSIFMTMLTNVPTNWDAAGWFTVGIVYYLMVNRSKRLVRFTKRNLSKLPLLFKAQFSNLLKSFSFKRVAFIASITLLFIPVSHSLRLPATVEKETQTSKLQVTIEAPQNLTPEVTRGQRFRFVWLGGGPILNGTISQLSQVGTFDFFPSRGNFFPKGFTSRIIGEFDSTLKVNLNDGSHGMAKISLPPKPLFYVLFRRWIDSIRFSFWELT